jgi:UTP-glucose-1-phosphate uridylyltransferase
MGPALIMFAMTAIIPAAGLGTRMFAVTGGAPKELLMLGDRTVLDRVVDEARQAGCDDVVVVSSPRKPSLDEAAKALGARIAWQPEMHGLADAVARAQVSDDALILLGDTVFWPDGRMSAQLCATIVGGANAAILVEEVAPEIRSQYGIVEGPGIIVEKPKHSDSPWAVCARYAFSAESMRELPEFLRQWSTPGEVPLTPFINTLGGFRTVPLTDGVQRVDCGSVEEYRAAQELKWKE